MQEASTFDIKEQSLFGGEPCLIDTVEIKANEALNEIRHQMYRLEKQRLKPVAIYISRDLLFAIVHQGYTNLHTVSHGEFNIFGIPAYQVLHDNHIRVVYET